MLQKMNLLVCSVFWDTEHLSCDPEPKKGDKYVVRFRASSLAIKCVVSIAQVGEPNLFSKRTFRCFSLLIKTAPYRYAKR
jgi:hypothetical protein